MNRSLTTVFLAIAPEKQLLLLHRLAPETWSVIAECEAPTHLLAHLQHQGWDAELGQDGAIYVTASQHSALDIEQNPLLQHAAGCASAGSVVQGYGEANEQWQLRYADNACTLVKGGVVFPALSTWEQQTRALLWVRELRPADHAQIAALHTRPLDPRAGTVLVALKGGVIQAYMQYQAEPVAAQTAIITRVATQVHGRHYGYPQAIVKHLQRHYQMLIIARHSAHVRAGYQHVWKQTGFVECSSGSLAGTFVWHAPHQSI